MNSISNNPNTIERKDFLKQVGMGVGAIMLMNCLQSCTDGEIPDPNPGGGSDKVDITIDLNTAAYSALNTKGGSKVVPDPKIIVARTLDDNFIAVNAECTHQQTIINYRPATNDFLCPNHGSQFSATGAVTKSPATAALTKYFTSFDETANTLRIFA